MKIGYVILTAWALVLATISAQGDEKPDELYHLHNDPGEQNNLVQQNPKLAASPKKNLEAWLKSARHSYEKGDCPGYDKQGIFIRTKP